jgi:hypothetical protein
MKPSGYSGKPLVAKLGYEPGNIVCMIAMPEDIQTYLQAGGIKLGSTLPATWCHGFFTWQKDLNDFLAHANLATIEKGLWVSWPKKAAGVPTDLTEQTFRDEILPMGWVDTKIAAIDQTWSGLKFLRRK